MAEEAHLPRDEIAATSPVASEAGNQTLPPSQTGSPPSTEVGIIPSTLSLIERIARDPTIDIDRLERMLALQERLIERDATTQYNEAMNRAQEEIQPVARTAENTQTRSFYAKLEHVDAAIRPIYLRHGFSLSYDTVEPLVTGNVRVKCSVAHVGGHSETFHREAGPDTVGPKGVPNKTVLHGQASTETFLKRYITTGIFNVVFKDMDNDGNGALSQDQVDYIVDLIGKARVGPKFLQYMKAQSVEKAGSLEAAVASIAAKDYQKAISTLEEQIKKAEVNAHT
ncbi:MAG TPA: ERF family protein [Candidatus Sulfotelmatobacter sp.]|jgi:hypothetical protein